MKSKILLTAALIVAFAGAVLFVGTMPNSIPETEVEDFPNHSEIKDYVIIDMGQPNKQDTLYGTPSEVGAEIDSITLAVDSAARADRQKHVLHPFTY